MSFAISEMSFTVSEMSLAILAEMSFGQDAQKKSLHRPDSGQMVHLPDSETG